MDVVPPLPSPLRHDAKTGAVGVLNPFPAPTPGSPRWFPPPDGWGGSFMGFFQKDPHGQGV